MMLNTRLGANKKERKEKKREAEKEGNYLRRKYHLQHSAQTCA